MLTDWFCDCQKLLCRFPQLSTLSLTRSVSALELNLTHISMSVGTSHHHLWGHKLGMLAVVWVSELLSILTSGGRNRIKVAVYRGSIWQNRGDWVFIVFGYTDSKLSVNSWPEKGCSLPNLPPDKIAFCPFFIPRKGFNNQLFQTFAINYLYYIQINQILIVYTLSHFKLNVPCFFWFLPKFLRCLLTGALWSE